MRKCPLRILIALKTPAVSILPPVPRLSKDRGKAMPPWLCFSTCQQLAVIFRVCMCVCTCACTHTVIWARSLHHLVGCTEVQLSARRGWAKALGSCGGLDLEGGGRSHKGTSECFPALLLHSADKVAPFSRCHPSGKSLIHSLFSE